MGSKLFFNLDQGFRFAPPLALCYCPLQGLRASLRLGLDGLHRGCPCNKLRPTRRIVHIRVDATENRYMNPI
jgi:hypothetical protein